MNRIAGAFIWAAVALFGARASLAQVVPSAVGPGAYVAVGTGVSGFQAVYGQRYLGGGLIYTDVHPQWRVGLEGEARFLRFHTSEHVTETNYIGGPRVLILRSHDVELYAKFLLGMGRITLPFDQAHGSFLAYVPGGGVDIAPITMSLCGRSISNINIGRGFPSGLLAPTELVPGYACA